MLSPRHHPAHARKTVVPSAKRQTRLIMAIGFAATLVGSQFLASIESASIAGPVEISAPRITLASDGQAANRVALSLQGLAPGHDVITSVDVTNAGNQALAGVSLALTSAAPGIEIAAAALNTPVQAGETVRYAVKLSATTPLPQDLSQVVVAFTPSK